MKSETDREIDMKKILNITDKKMQMQIIDKVKEDIDLEDLTIGYFIKKYLLKNEFIASEKLWSRYRELYDEGKKKGFIPIIIDGDFDTVVLNSARNIKNPINEIGIKDRPFSENLLKEYQDEFNDTVKSLPKKKSIKNTTLSGVGKVLIIELRIDYPYELFKIIPFGGFNDCPAPKIQYQVAKQWYKNFGAIPIIIGEDYIQYYMKNDIKNIDELRRIVCEQCCYCELEGQTIKEFANSVYNDRFWYFWWD